MKRLTQLLSAMLVISGFVGIANATLITQDIVFDLEAGYPLGSISAGYWTGITPIDEVSFQAGDTYIAKIHFANNKALRIGGLGDELYKVRMLFKDQSSNVWHTKGSCTFHGVGGELLVNPAPFDIQGSGQAYAGPFTKHNLTDTFFYYNGVDIEINFVSYDLLSGSGIFNRLEWTSGGGAQVIDWTAPVPEPSTVLLLGFGLISLAGFRREFRRK